MTTFYQKKNNAYSTLLATINNSQTTLTVQVSEASRFPASGSFPITVWYAANNISTGEIMLVTGVSANTFTVTRAQENTSAQAWNVNTGTVNVWMNYTAGVGQQEDTAINNLENTNSTYLNQLYTDSGATNAYAIAPSPSIGAYAKGQKFSFIPANANTGASTLNVNSLGTKAIQFQGNVLLAGQISTSATATVIYDGTNFQLQAVSLGAWTSWTPTYSASGSMTYTSVSTTNARFFQLGKLVFFQLSVSGTTGGSTDNTIFITAPVTAATVSQIFSGNLSPAGGSNVSAYGRFNSTTQFSVSRYDSANITLGAGTAVRISGVYEAA